MLCCFHFFFLVLCVAVRRYKYLRGMLPVSKGESLYNLNLYVCRRESMMQFGTAVLDYCSSAIEAELTCLLGSS